MCLSVVSLCVNLKTNKQGNKNENKTNRRDAAVLHMFTFMNAIWKDNGLFYKQQRVQFCLFLFVGFAFFFSFCVLCCVVLHLCVCKENKYSEPFEAGS